MLNHKPYVIVSHVVNTAVTEGFIPAAQKLGYPVVLLTDHAVAHNQVLDDSVRVIECEVFNPLSILDTLTEWGITPAALFSNSDHLQTATAIAATAIGLPTKDWQICYFSVAESAICMVNAIAAPGTAVTGLAVAGGDKTGARGGIDGCSFAGRLCQLPAVFGFAPVASDVIGRSVYDRPAVYAGNVR